MRLLTHAAIAAALATAILAPTESVAQDSGGLSSMHDQRREAGRVCMSDHYHYGTGSGPSKKAALADAVGSWQSFTDFEYGGTWARWSRAASKQVAFSSSASGFSANINARPCR